MAPAAGEYGASLNELERHSRTLHNYLRRNMEECTTASQVPGVELTHTILARFESADAASRRVPANEAPAHGFSGGHLLLKGYSNGIRLLFDAYGLGFLWNKEGVNHAP